MKWHHPAVVAGMAFAGLAVSPGTFAQTAASQAGQGQGQGMMSAQQHATGASAMFKRMDADGDGYVTAAEMEAFRPMMGAAQGRGAGMPMGAGTMMGPGMMMTGPGMMMGTIDSDRDGSISAQEHAAAAKATFERLDTDRDGRITEAEWSAAHQSMPASGAGMPRGAGMAGAGMPGMPAAGAGMGMGAMGMGPWHSSADWLERMDRDGDGRVSAAEHGAGTQALFEEADTDNDGNLSAAEMTAHRALMMKRGQGTPGKNDKGGGR